MSSEKEDEDHVVFLFKKSCLVKIKGITASLNYWWLARYVTEAILVELEQKNIINFFCLWHQHGRQTFVFWISRDWLQVINK